MKASSLVVLAIALMVACFVAVTHHPPTLKRNAPLTLKRNGSDCGSQDNPLLDPAHNIKGVVQNCLLLEQHLASERCLDCVTKHLMIISGLLDEAAALFNAKEYHRAPYVGAIRACQRDALDIERALMAPASNETPMDLARRVRALRKRLMPHLTCTVNAKRFYSAPTFEVDGH
jgi:hypothetical protein